MLRRFYRRSGGHYEIPYDHASGLLTVVETIDHGICVVGEGACAGALLAPFPYNRQHLVAQVVFWYFEGKSGIGVFDALARACAKAGATNIEAAALPPRCTGKRFYEQRGLSLSEYHFLGSLESYCKSPEEG
jgi:hypothetical protein